MLLRMHKRKPDFDPLKFTPLTIHNKIELNKQSVIEYFHFNHTLADCAKEFSCSKTTIKRRLRVWGIDTSIYNHSEIAKTRSREKSIENKTIPSNEEIEELYLHQNLDSKTIAEQFDLHYQTIRIRIKKMGLKKSGVLVSKSMMARHQLHHGCPHPAQRPDVIVKTRRSTVKVKYCDVIGRLHEFRALSELEFALLQDNLNNEWYYEEMRVPYVDMLTGKRRIYIVDFTVVSKGNVSWIEIKPNENMIPEDKRIYAERLAEASGVEYRGLVEDERKKGRELFNSGYRMNEYEYVNLKPSRSATQITRWFKSRQLAEKYTESGWNRLSIKECNPHLFSLKLKRCELK